MLKFYCEMFFLVLALRHVVITATNDSLSDSGSTSSVVTKTDRLSIYISRGIIYGTLEVSQGKDFLNLKIIDRYLRVFIRKLFQFK